MNKEERAEYRKKIKDNLDRANHIQYLHKTWVDLVLKKTHSEIDYTLIDLGGQNQEACNGDSIAFVFNKEIVNKQYLPKGIGITQSIHPDIRPKIIKVIKQRDSLREHEACVSNLMSIILTNSNCTRDFLRLIPKEYAHFEIERWVDHNIFDYKMPKSDAQIKEIRDKHKNAYSYIKRDKLKDMLLRKNTGE